jgi:hypothetical protein
LFVNPEIKRKKYSESLLKYKKGSTVKKEKARSLYDSMISQNEIEMRTLQCQLDRVRDRVRGLLTRWETAFRNAGLKSYVQENYPDDFKNIVGMIRNELGIRVA